ncbi:hypothetical protein H0H93_004572 [Arthromyces matolae]|nr:hypothetical protein H0H93_004572 [Arthromyces matolae]
MKTIFMQQIIALVIVTTSITSISGTPLPQTQAASLLRVREVPSPRSFDSASLHRLYGEQLVEVTSTLAEFDASVPAPRSFLISPRASPEEIDSIISSTRVELNKLADAALHSKDVKDLDTFLKGVIKAYTTLLELEKPKGNEAGLQQLRELVLENIGHSLNDLLVVFKDTRTSKITEETGKPLIEHLIKIAEMSKSDPQVVRDEAQLVLAAIDLIMEKKFRWDIITDANVGLEKAQRDLKEKYKELAGQH